MKAKKLVLKAYFLSLSKESSLKENVRKHRTSDILSRVHFLSLSKESSLKVEIPIDELEIDEKNKLFLSLSKESSLKDDDYRLDQLLSEPQTFYLFLKRVL